MRSSYRRKRADHVINQAVTRRAGNRKDRNYKKKGTCMRLWALIGAAAVMTAGLAGMQADAVYAAQYASPNGGTSQEDNAGRQDDIPKEEGVGQQGDTPQNEDDMPGDRDNIQNGDTQPEEGDTDGDSQSSSARQGEEKSSGGNTIQNDEEVPEQDVGMPDNETQDSAGNENGNGQQDEIMEETESGSPEKPQDKEEGEESPQNRTRRNPPNPDKIQDKLRKGIKGESQTETGGWVPKVTWGTDTRILKMIRSIGRIQYGQAVIDADDLRSIWTYISEKKYGMAGILMRLGTRFRQQSESVYTIDRNPDTVQEDIDISQIDWQTLLRAAAESQNVPGKLAVLNPQAAMHIEGVEERTDYYETAVEDNISRGKAAWADGILLLGNGADNDKARRKGEQEGEKGDVPEPFLPVYEASEEYVEIGHVHIGRQENKDGISGCYKNSHTTRQETSKCGAELKKTEATFYPNPDEPGGGSWHGGEYTCPHHGGMYKNPGTCDHKSTKTVTVWKHEIVCGLEDVIFAGLTVRGQDTDYSDRAICLEAVLTAEEGYEHLAWQEGDELIWTDETGNTLGIGSRLMVYTAGTYRCNLNVANDDINRKSVDTSVRIIGLVAPGN